MKSLIAADVSHNALYGQCFYINEKSNYHINGLILDLSHELTRKLLWSQVAQGLFTCAA
jgi:hypothetical protein